MTFFCFIWHFLHKIIDKNRVFADQTYIFPPDKAILSLAEQAEKPRSAVNYQSCNLCTFDVYLKIVDESYAASVRRTDHFFSPELLQSAGQVAHLPATYYSFYSKKIHPHEVGVNKLLTNQLHLLLFVNQKLRLIQLRTKNRNHPSR